MKLTKNVKKFHKNSEVSLLRWKVSLLRWSFVELILPHQNYRLIVENIYHGHDTMVKLYHDLQSFYFFHQKIIFHGHFFDHDFSSFTKWNQKKCKIAPIQKQLSRSPFCNYHGLFQIPLANPIFTFLVKPSHFSSETKKHDFTLSSPLFFRKKKSECLDIKLCPSPL